MPLASGLAASNAVIAPLLIAIACLAIAAALWFIGGHLPRLTLLLVITASTGLAGTALGNTVHRAVQGAVGQAHSAIAALSGDAVGLLVGALLAYVLYIHWTRRQVSYTTLGAGAFLPMIASAVPGFLGRVLGMALSLCLSVFTALFHAAGMH